VGYYLLTPFADRNHRVAAQAQPIAGADDTVGAGIDFRDPHSPLAPYYMRVSDLGIIVFLAFLFFAAAHFPLWHTDVWGFVKYGQWMAEHCAIPAGEPFCPWWDGRQEFTQFYTISELVMFGCYALGGTIAGGDDVSQMSGGVEMLRTLHALLTVARLAVLMAVFWRVSRSRLVTILGAVLVLSLDLSNLAVFRPQSFAQLFFAIMLWPLSAPVLSRRAVVALPALMALWANTHGSYIVGFALLGVYTAGRICELVLKGVTRPREFLADQSTRYGAIAFVLAFAAVATLNPYGPDLFRRTIALSNHPSLTTAVGEWKPLAFVWKMGWHWVFMVSLLGIAGLQLVAKSPMKPARILALLVFGCGVALQNRFVIWWAMVVPWAVLPQLAELFAAGRRRLSTKILAADEPDFRKTLLCALVTVVGFLWSVPGGWLLHGTPTELESSISAGTPWRVARSIQHLDRGEPALDAALKQYPDGRFRGAILATPMQGDYLMWSLSPEVPVTYAHIHLFPPDFWEELGIVGNGLPGWWDVLEKYQINLLVVESDYARNLREELKKSPHWLIVKDETDDPAKQEPLNRQLVAIRKKPL
jgi:hypothetical protein